MTRNRKNAAGIPYVARPKKTQSELESISYLKKQKLEGKKKQRGKSTSNSNTSGLVKDLKRLHVVGFEKSELTSTEDDLKKLYKGYTEFNLQIKKENKKKHKGSYAFIRFNTEADAKKALTDTIGKEFNGRKLIVNYAYEKPTTTKTKNPTKKEETVKPVTVSPVKQIEDPKAKQKDLKRLHIVGFDKDKETLVELKKLCAGFTKFDLTVKKKTKTLLNRGNFAFVGFATEEAAKQAFDSINGKDLNGSKLGVNYAYEKPPKIQPPAPKKPKKVEKEKKEAENESGDDDEAATMKNGKAVKKVKGENGVAKTVKKEKEENGTKVVKAKGKKQKNVKKAKGENGKALKRKAEESDDDENSDEE